MRTNGSTLRLLIRLFLRRFLDSDIMAPGADRHDALAIAFATLVTVSIFLSFSLTAKYLTDYIQLPGTTAHLLLSDRFVLIAVAMTTTALVTLLMWDALGLEPRDGSILGPLPLRVRTIAAAKLTALLLFAAAFALTFAATSALYSLLMMSHLQPSLADFFRIVGVQALTMISASACAFATVLAIRGVLQALVSERWFDRLSPVAQTLMIVAAMSALLLLPFANVDVARDWMRQDAPRAVRMLPPLWFVGIEGALEGHVVSDLPVLVPPRTQLPRWMRVQNERNRIAYRAYDDTFPRLARSAVRMLAVATLVALLGLAWNSRRLRLPTMWPLRRGRFRTAVARWAAHTVAPHPTKRAGFSFALTVLARSAPHRMVMSASLAFGLTAAIVLARSSWDGLAGIARDGLPPVGFLAAPLAIVATLVCGFRHAVRVPAELSANWTIQMVWQNDRQAFLSGCRRAALVALIAAPLLIVLPLAVPLMGFPLAVVHLLSTGFAALTLLDALLIGVVTVPFASPYVPLDNPKLVWPVSVVALFAVPSAFAAVARLAFGAAHSAVVFMAAVGLVAAVAVVARRRQEGRAAAIPFEHVAVASTQRLGLHERIIG